MDKYQLNLLNRGTIAFTSELGEEKAEMGENLTLYQNENYKVGNYKIIISNASIESITYQSKRYASNNNVVTIDFDFDNVGTELVISFKNGLADECRLPLQAVQSDKGAFDKKEAKEQREQLIANVGLVVAAGPGLINVFWNKANSDVVKTVVKVSYYHTPSSGESREYPVFEKETESYYLSLTGLAYGTYRCVIEEHSSKGLVISVEGNVALNNPVTVMKQEAKEIKELQKAVGRAAGGHWVHN